MRKKKANINVKENKTEEIDRKRKIKKIGKKRYIDRWECLNKTNDRGERAAQR